MSPTVFAPSYRPFCLLFWTPVFLWYAKDEQEKTKINCNIHTCALQWWYESVFKMTIISQNRSDSEEDMHTIAFDVVVVVAVFVSFRQTIKGDVSFQFVPFLWLSVFLSLSFYVFLPCSFAFLFRIFSLLARLNSPQTIYGRFDGRNA